jgi:SAM-dependent methyltransferase
VSAIDQLVEELRAYMRPHVLAVAVELGLLDAMSAGPATTRELERACGIEGHFLANFLGVLRSYGLVEPADDDATFRPTPLGSEAASHPVFRSFAGYHAFNFEGWCQLRETCQSPEPRGGRFHWRRSEEPRFRQNYLRSMEVIAQNSLPFIRREFHRLAHKEFGRVEGLRVLDLGAGPATFTRTLSADGASVTAIDLPPMVEDARRLFGEPSGFSWHPGDFRTVAVAPLFDVVFCSHVLEYYDIEAVIERVTSWLAPRALLVGVMFLRAGDPKLDAGLDLFEISTWLNGEERGRIVTVADISACLQARFHRVEVQPIPSNVSYSEFLVTAAWDGA